MNFLRDKWPRHSTKGLGASSTRWILIHPAMKQRCKCPFVFSFFNKNSFRIPARPIATSQKPAVDKATLCKYARQNWTWGSPGWKQRAKRTIMTRLRFPVSIYLVASVLHSLCKDGKNTRDSYRQQCLLLQEQTYIIFNNFQKNQV